MGRFAITIALCVVLMGASVASTAWARGGLGVNFKPLFIQGPIKQTYYKGVDNDLLTGGLGASGLANPTPPAFANPLEPTAKELRTRAIHGNYRALVDTAPGGGYGTFFGPTVNAEGEPTGDDGLIPGHEYLAYARSGLYGRVTLMVQIPDSFDLRQPCVVTAPSSGSRGIYGAIGTAGEWGLKRGCAVAYTDKGTGTGAHNLEDDVVQLIDGVLADADAAGRRSQFTAALSDARRQAYVAEAPHRFAFKHAHSQQNPEAHWGRNVLQSVDFAFYLLNERFGRELKLGSRRLTFRTIAPANTLVIASSVSNGGGSSVLAAEQDRRGLIDGVAVSEPNVNPRFDDGFSIVQGDREPLQRHSRSLYDYTTLLAVYQGCANLAQPDAPLNLAPVPDACASLQQKGLLTANTLEQQAREAQAIINDYGFLPEQNPLQPSHWFLNAPQAIVVTYANAYGRFPVTRDTCGFSFAATDREQGGGVPVPLPEAAEAVLFASSNGIPPTGGVNVVYNESANGPVDYREGVSPSTGLSDYSLDGLLCLRGLATRQAPVTGEHLRGRDAFAALRVALGISRIRADGDLNGKPAVFVTGRADAIIPPNHASRAYFGLNQRVEGDSAGLRYYEVLNAQHLDTLNGLPAFAKDYVPLHHYFFQAMDLMYAHLRDGEPLPPSQVVRTTPRGLAEDGTVPPLTLANIPPVAQSPAAGDRIRFTANQVRIPD